MPSERGNEKALWKWANHLHRAFLLLLHIFCVRRKCSRRRRKASRRAWWLLHCKPSGRTVLCEAGIPMRKSGEKPYLEGIASAPSTGPHGINGGSGNRAVLQTGERPFLILLKKVRKGPPKQSKAGVLHHAGFCMDSFCFLDGVFPKRRCSCAFAEVASASALAERSTLRGGGVPVCTAAGFSSESGGIRPAPFSAFRFCFGLPALRLLADFGCAARRIFRRVSGKGVKNRKKGLTT